MMIVEPRHVIPRYYIENNYAYSLKYLFYKCNGSGYVQVMAKEETMQANPLSQRGRALEETYFRRLEEENLRRRRTAYRRQLLSSQLEIDDAELLDSLIELGVTAENAAAFDFVPLLELVWADGKVDNDQRGLILDFAHSFGMEPGGPAYERLDLWLTERPSGRLFEAWYTLAASGLTGRDTGQRSRRWWAVTHALAVARSRKARGAGSKQVRDTAKRIEVALRAGAESSAAAEVEAVA
jgi:hypothetical protein